MIYECNWFVSSFKMNDRWFYNTDVIIFGNFLIFTWHDTEKLTAFESYFEMSFYKTENNLLELVFTLQGNKFVSELSEILINNWLNQGFFVWKIIFDETFKHFEKMFRSEVVMTMCINTEAVQYLVVSVDEKLSQSLWQWVVHFFRL